MRGARAAVKLKSEHVARVFEVGRLENDAPYMVMERLDGSDLSAWPRTPFESACGCSVPGRHAPNETLLAGALLGGLAMLRRRKPRA